MAASSEPARDTIYLDYTQDDLDRAYTQSEWAANAGAILARWQESGIRIRTGCRVYAEHAYGASDEERIDVFEARGATVHFHIHGGAWQRQSKEDCSFMAPAMLNVGAPFAVPEFGRLPGTRMPDVLEQIARALRWTYERLVVQGPAEDILVSGHSSGAHMAALLASYDFGGALPLAGLRGVLCVSGSYDLDPVLLSCRRSYIDLTPDEAARLSPIRRVDQTRVPVHLLYGDGESPEFARQSRAFATALGRAGRLASCIEMPNANHFEIADALGDPHTTAGRYLRQLLTMPNRAADLAGTDLLGRQGDARTPGPP